MNEVICEFCGTVFSEFEEKCPVCGASRSLAFAEDASVQEDDFLREMEILSQPQEEQTPEEPVKRNKQIFDFDQYQDDDEEEETEEETEEEDSYDNDPDAEDEDYSQYSEGPRTNMVLVVVLVIVIALLLLAVGFLFFRFLLPNMGGKGEPLPTLAVTEPVETQTPAVETTELSIPCTDLSIPGGEIVLVAQGRHHLLNVRVYPEDTTDALTFVSADESIATVDHDGKITAQSEGETTVTISCGTKSMHCKVLVDYSLATEPTEAETLPSVQSAAETAPAGTEESAEPDSSGNAQTGETTAPTEKSKLKLKKTDVTLFARYVSYTVEMDCDLQPDQLEWITMDSSVCIVIDGVVTATGPGSTRIIGTYDGESVECVIRCNF